MEIIHYLLGSTTHILETTRRDIKGRPDVRVCVGGGWGLLGPLTPWASLRVWGERYGFGQMFPFLSSPVVSLHTPYTGLMVATKGPSHNCLSVQQGGACTLRALRDEPVSPAVWTQDFHRRSAQRPRAWSLLVPFQSGVPFQPAWLVSRQVEKGLRGCRARHCPATKHWPEPPQPSSPLDAGLEGWCFLPPVNHVAVRHHMSSTAPPPGAHTEPVDGDKPPTNTQQYAQQGSLALKGLEGLTGR